MCGNASKSYPYQPLIINLKIDCGKTFPLNLNQQ